MIISFDKSYADQICIIPSKDHIDFRTSVIIFIEKCVKYNILDKYCFLLGWLIDDNIFNIDIQQHITAKYWKKDGGFIFKHYL